MNARRRTLMTEIGAIAAPLVIVGFTRVVMSPVAVAPVNAQGSTAAIVPVSVKRVDPTPEQKVASEWARSIDLTGAMTSPLDHPRGRPDPTPVAAPKAAPEPVVVHAAPAPPTDPLAGLSLSATLSTKTGGGLAAINGKIYHVGDEVRSGCKLVSVDTGTNQVQIKLPDGKTVRLGRDLSNGNK